MTVREFTVNTHWGSGGTDPTNNLRQAGTRIRDALVAVGLVQTTDTGQMDLATVVSSSTAGVSMGYQIFRLGDGSLGLPMIFIKIEYKTANYHGSWPGMAVTTGSGTDGAGTLTGQVSYRAVDGGSTSFSFLNAQNSCQVSSDGSTYFWMQIGDNYLQSGIAMMLAVVDRARNADGSASPDGWMFNYQRHATNQTKNTEGQNVNLKTGGATSTHSGPLQSCAFYGNFQTLAFGNDLFFYPHYFNNPMVYSASPVILGHLASEITYGTKPVVNVYGVDRTFFSLGTKAGAWSIQNNQNHGVMLRWDV